MPLDVYIDDTGLEAAGTEDSIVQGLIVSGSELHKGINQMMVAEIAMGKVAMVCSSKAIAFKLQQHFGPLVGAPRSLSQTSTTQEVKYAQNHRLCFDIVLEGLAAKKYSALDKGCILTADALADGAIDGVDKVKANPELDQPLDVDELFKRKGNDWADRAAKLGAALHPDGTEVLQTLGRRCVLIDCSDASFVCICQWCGSYTSGERMANLAKKCVLLASPHKNVNWRLLGRELHPRQTGVKVDLSTFWPLGVPGPADAGPTAPSAADGVEPGAEMGGPGTGKIGPNSLEPHISEGLFKRQSLASAGQHRRPSLAPSVAQRAGAGPAEGAPPEFEAYEIASAPLERCWGGLWRLRRELGGLRGRLLARDPRAIEALLPSRAPPLTRQAQQGLWSELAGDEVNVPLAEGTARRLAELFAAAASELGREGAPPRDALAAFRALLAAAQHTGSTQMGAHLFAEVFGVAWQRQRDLGHLASILQAAADAEVGGPADAAGEAAADGRGAGGPVPGAVEPEVEEQFIQEARLARLTSPGPEDERPALALGALSAALGASGAAGGPAAGGPREESQLGVFGALADLFAAGAPAAAGEVRG
ncbi:unnamed protein product [Prorocentrum cordatum]|uniref:Uncharacterized protein n=1 Tax=Prorocentrum cordatum TaxID=2364126 RepID=A0ABN9P746_9DINO|nr:unnamed protein product [Polarella glacialis]